ncbi:hypothetical protein [Streptomyces coelicoflavus]|uniref:hypothetical protein n=1 Tax=Streptomyces coelicoflavus TaxID=285562 RepID=UPI003A867FB1
MTLLVMRLRERAQPVDGAGGDGGRDLFEYTDDDKLVVYEAKSFTGRMTPGRRRQVRKSLVSVARHQPDHWDLLVPIDPNPAEQAWFDGLRGEFEFVRHWRGRIWLDEKCAAHPDLVRYALQESADYILERIAQARAERDVLHCGISDYLERARALHGRVQEISPHYAVQTLLDADGRTVVHLSPRGPDPDGQGAIRLTGPVRFAGHDGQEARRRQRFEEVMRFGGEVELSADNLAEATLSGPAGLGLERIAVGGVRISSARQEVTPPLQGQVAVQLSSGVPLASLPVRFTQRVSGSDGGILYGSDMTGVMRVRLRYSHGDRSAQLKFTFQPPEAAMPLMVSDGLGQYETEVDTDVNVVDVMRSDSDPAYAMAVVKVKNRGEECPVGAVTVLFYDAQGTFYSEGVNHFMELGRGDTVTVNVEAISEGKAKRAEVVEVSCQ